MKTTSEARIASNLRQISALRARRDGLVSECLTQGIDRAECRDRCEAIGEQICELYAEIDAIEAGETKVKAIAAKSDEAEAGGRRTAGWVNPITRANSSRQAAAARFFARFKK